MTNLQAVMEAYAGKSKELIECEGYIREIIKEINEDHEPLRLNRSRNVYRENPYCKKLETTLTKFFGVKEIRIYWYNGSINAFTLPASSIITSVRRNKKDFSKAVFNVCIYEELVYYAELNESEIMAVILHEIGHCFYSSPLLIASELLSITTLPISLISKFLLIGKLEINQFLKKNLPLIPNVMGLFGDIKTQYYKLFKFTIIGFNPVAAIKCMKNPVSSLANYGNERGADSLTAKYGYGADQASALRKMTRAEGTIGGSIQNDTFIGSVFGDLSELTLDLFAMMTLDEHPNTDQRVNSMINKLERDLRNGDYPPKVKKELEMEIERLKDVHEHLNDNDNRVAIKKVYYNIVNNITNGHSDIRELLDKFYIKYEF